MGRLEAHPTISITFLLGGLGELPIVNNITVKHCVPVNYKLKNYLFGN
jgi:hypothetical protein